MKRYIFSMAILAFISLVLAVSVNTGYGAVGSEISPSVQFDKGMRVSMLDLRGKVVLVLFFQSSNKECNRLSKELFKQIQKAADGRSDVVLMALKTDGKRVKDAKKYLKGKIDFSKWLVGVDPNAAYCQSAIGNKKVFQYNIIAPGGGIHYRGGAAAFEEEDGKKTDSITAKELKTYLAKAKTSPLLPRDKAYQESLAFAVRSAELGQYGKALLECKKYARRPATKDAAVALQKDILEALNKKIQSKIKILNNKSTKSPGRYEAFLTLHTLTKLRKLPVSKNMQAVAEEIQKNLKEAKKTIKEAAKDPGIAKEQKAHKAYMRFQNKVKRLPEISKNKDCRTALGKIGEQFPDTLFGEMAKTTSLRMMKHR